MWNPVGENALYLVVALTSIVIIFLIMFRLLHYWEQQRQIRVVHKDNLQVPVSTASPLKNPLKQERDTAVNSVKSRFSIIRRLVILFFIVAAGLVTVLPFIGAIPKAMISLVVAASSVILGISAKPFLENFISGIVMTFSRPFRTGDTVLIDEKYYGTVEDITMTYTIVKSWDWRRYVVPNAKMMTKEFVNLTLNDSFLWSYVEFWVAPDADLETVKAKAIAAAESSESFDNCEPPNFWVMEMGEKGIRCWVAAWADSPADAWELSSDIRTELARQLKILKITPHRFTLDIHNTASADALANSLQSSCAP